MAEFRNKKEKESGSRAIGRRRAPPSVLRLGERSGSTGRVTELATYCVALRRRLQVPARDVGLVEVADQPPLGVEHGRSRAACCSAAPRRRCAGRASARSARRQRCDGRRRGVDVGAVSRHAIRISRCALAAAASADTCAERSRSGTSRDLVHRRVALGRHLRVVERPACAAPRRRCPRRASAAPAGRSCPPARTPAPATTAACARCRRRTCPCRPARTRPGRCAGRRAAAAPRARTRRRTGRRSPATARSRRRCRREPMVSDDAKILARHRQQQQRRARPADRQPGRAR